MKRRILIGATVGGIIGLVINHLLVGWWKYTAEIALKLRPELVNLTFWESLWSGHFWHWWWITNPSLAYVWSAVILMLVGIGLVIYLVYLVED